VTPGKLADTLVLCILITGMIHQREIKELEQKVTRAGMFEHWFMLTQD